MGDALSVPFIVSCCKTIFNKNALTGKLSLACLEIRSRNEEAINSTRNRIYLLQVFHFLLYRRSRIFKTLLFIYF